MKGFAYETTVEDVKAFFGDCGSVADARMLTHADGNSKCICFVDFEDTEAVDAAYKKNQTKALGAATNLGRRAMEINMELLW